MRKSLSAAQVPSLNENFGDRSSLSTNNPNLFVSEDIASKALSSIPGLVPGVGYGKIYALKTYGAPDQEKLPDSERAAAEEKFKDVMRQYFERTGDMFDGTMGAKNAFFRQRALATAQAIERKIYKVLEQGYNVDYAITKGGQDYIALAQGMIDEENEAERLAPDVFDPSVRTEYETKRTEGKAIIEMLRGLLRGDVSIPDEPVVVVAKEVDIGSLTHIEDRLIRGVLGHVGNSSHLHGTALDEKFPIGLISNDQYEELSRLPSGTEVAVLCHKVKGTLIASAVLNPSDSLKAQIEERRQELEAVVTDNIVQPVTKDGDNVQVLITMDSANVDRINDSMKSECSIGLVRTERILRNFMRRANELDIEQEELGFYRSLIAASNNEAPVIRTLDISNDKEAYLELVEPGSPVASNSRVTCRQLKSQITKILQAAHLEQKPVKVLFPNIRNEADWTAYMKVAEEAQLDFIDRFDSVPKVEFGAQAESLEAAETIGSVLSSKFKVDFVAIGSSDLTLDAIKHTEGHENDNRADTDLDPHYPAIWKAIGRIGQVIGACDRDVSLHLCGFMGDLIDVYPLLLGAGLTKFTADVSSAGDVSMRVQSLSIDDCKKLYRAAVNSESPSQVKGLLDAFNRRFPA